ncbi:hypothetical protein AA0Y32_09130 [Georgenia phoenicis]|uniref:hypothetical protein n=1 Tax=unclassified Georgenia TaxID=2626815 RepID=UPI0039B0B76C
MKRVANPEALPTTSVAEFRRAAWPLLDDNLSGAVVMRLYLTWGVLGAGLCVLVLGTYGLTETAMSWWLVLGAVVVITLVVLRVRKHLGRAADVRRRVDTLSREVDARAARGVIPLVPDGWSEPLPAPPHERTSSWL